MPNIFTSIITAIRTKDFASANEGIATVLQNKVAARLATERQTVNEETTPADEGAQSAKIDNAIRAALKRGDKDTAVKLLDRANEAGGRGKHLTLADYQ
jgi:hypothetical protein